MLSNAVEEMNVGQFRIGSRSSSGAGYGTGASRDANRYPGTACPPGQVVVSRGADHHAPKYIGGPTSSPYVFCKEPPPRAAPAPPPPVAGPTYTTTISPVLQTEVSPQISPVFQQTQDSPGAVQAGTPTQYKPGGMEATGGGSAAPGSGGGDAMLEFMRMQEQTRASERAAETKRREQERRDAAAREAKLQERQQQFQQQQLELQRQEQARAETARQQQLEMQRIEQERRAAEAAGRSEEAARLQEQYEQQQREWQQTKAEAPTFVSTAAPGMPGAPDAPPEAGLMVPPAGPNWPLIAGIGALVLVGGYYLTTQKKGKRK